ncbi:MAG: Na/Pi cotransporter family protein, partial [Clostridia bacterium]|nr:Na/Pi cotransporter family protein [Clostridia bacterium]
GLGCAITAVLHSSSAVSCSVCAMVAGGSMELAAAYAVLVGSNVGTCVTPILTALGLQAGGVGLLFPLIGIAAVLLRPKFPRVASPVAGFCLLTWGMKAMGDCPAFFAALSEAVWWQELMGSPWGGFLVGLCSTALLQSSTLTMGLLQVYARSFPLSAAVAMPFILGQNIGTTATALLATLGEEPLAKRTALYHTRFNLYGALWALPLTILLRRYLTFDATPLALALMQLGYNVVCALLHLLLDPMLGQKRIFV